MAKSKSTPTIPPKKQLRSPTSNGHHLTAGYSCYAAGQTTRFLLQQDTGAPGDNFDYAAIAQERCDRAAANWESEAIQTLLAQAQTLETAFNRFLSLAALVKSHESAERYASLAFKAQSECRKTMLAIDAIKNPKKPTTFIKNYVDRQLNQLQVSPTPQELEPSSYAALDTGSQTEAIRTDSHLEAVAVEYRTDNP